MKALLTTLLVFAIILTPIIILTLKYKNPYKLIMVFGKKGSGKTTFIAKTAYKYIKQGRPVYSTVYVPGVHVFDVNDIGKCAPPPEAVIFIDEVGMIWDNRQYKNFRNDVRDYFKLQRHYHHTVYLFSQTFDIDIKLRNLTDAMYLTRCHMGWLSVARKIRRDIVLVEPTGDSEARIADSLQFEPLWLWLFGGKPIQLTFIPRWIKLFDSYDAPELQPLDTEYIEIPEHLKGFYKVKGGKNTRRRMDKNRIRKRFDRIKQWFGYHIFKIMVKVVQWKARHK